MKIFTTKLNSLRPWSLKVRDFSGVQNSWKSPNESFALLKKSNIFLEIYLIRYILTKLFYTQKYFGYLEFEI